ncbi:MAG: VPLPA-CTERM sorting domain-containing protein [Paracoccaceae bacterium]
MHRRFVPAALAACALVPTADAASVLGDEFQLSVDAVSNGEGGPFDATAGSRAVFGEFDLLEVIGDNEVAVVFLDADSFAIQFGFSADTATFALTGLDFAHEGMPADIIGISFNAEATDIASFTEENPAVTEGDFIVPFDLSFTPTSVTVSFGFQADELAADFIPVIFDIEVDDNRPADVIPLPASGWLLLAGLGALAGIRRRAGA